MERTVNPPDPRHMPAPGVVIVELARRAVCAARFVPAHPLRAH